MRFAYIDSQGKEVGIPTVEALRLRIELGAVTGDTMFYDAGKDRWDPAGDHEIFRTLSREIGERRDEVPRPRTPRIVASSEAGEEMPSPEPEVAPPEASRVPDPFDGEHEPLPETTGPGEVGWVEADLEDLAPPDGAAADARAGDAGPDLALGDFGDLELAPDLDQEREAGVDEGGPAPATDPEAAGDGLELEPSLAEQHGDESQVASGEDMELEGPLPDLGAELAAGWEEDTATERGGGPAEGPADPSPDPSAPVDATAGGRSSPATSAPADPGGVDETSAHATDVAPPGGGQDQDRIGAGADGADAVRKERARRDPYDRRVKPPRTDPPQRPPRRPRRRRSAGRTAALAAGVALVGLGGWFGWSAVDSPEAAEAADGVERPVLPPLPAALEASMREAADAAWSDAVDSLRAQAGHADLPEEPNPDWLAGIYLANAPDYPDVAAYWTSLRAYLDRVRAEEQDRFAAALAERLEASDVPPESRDTVAARARAGFLAAAPERQALYEGLGNLIQAATDLHAFLVGNATLIEYEPAVGVSRDPVTEAIPSTPELGEEMWARVGAIPDAMDALGELDRVTTERMLEGLHCDLAQVAVR